MVRLRRTASIKRNIHGIHNPDGTGRGCGYQSVWVKTCYVARCEDRPIQGYPADLCAKHLYELDLWLAEHLDILI